MLGQIWKQWGKELLVGLLVAFLIHAEVADARFVPTPSMAPTVMPGDRLLTEKVLVRLTGVRRGDIIVFKSPFTKQEALIKRVLGLHGDFLKRVIGLPGDKVEVRGGQVLINGQPLHEPYILSAPKYDYGPVTVPEGKLFVLGDNRNNSLDSHIWGFLDMEDVQARVILRIWPLNRVGRLQ